MPDCTGLVTRSNDRAWGAAVFAGTRVPVETLFDYLEAGETLYEFLRQVPTVSREQAIAVLESAKLRVTGDARSCVKVETTPRSAEIRDAVGAARPGTVTSLRRSGRD